MPGVVVADRNKGVTSAVKFLFLRGFSRTCICHETNHPFEVNVFCESVVNKKLIYTTKQTKKNITLNINGFMIYIIKQ